MKTFRAFTGLVMSFLISLSSQAQKSDRPISKEEQKQIIEKAFTLLKANYIFPAVIPTMEREINHKLSEGSYANHYTAQSFLKEINHHLESLSGDRHVNIFFDPIRVKQIEAETGSSATLVKYAPDFLERARFENYMVRKVERMDGNIGYLKFNVFVDTTLSRKTLSAAMDFLANSSALIIDLRQNGGGDARTCQFLLNFFLRDSTLIMQRRSRTAETTSHYTVPDPKVTKFRSEVPVYILTSKRTSSAAEAFAYTLQSYKRAVVIGDTTNGEANPGYLYALNKEMYIMIPAFENINPITKTNWQGRGVIPDNSIPAERALTLALAKAYEALAATSKNSEIKAMYEWMSTGLFAELRPIAVNEAELRSLEGDFADERHISFMNGTLYYHRGTNAMNKKRLLPMKTDLFGVDGVPYLRIRFIRNDQGNVIALEGLYDDGKKEISQKL